MNKKSYVYQLRSALFCWYNHVTIFCPLSPPGWRNHIMIRRGGQSPLRRRRWGRTSRTSARRCRPRPPGTSQSSTRCRTCEMSKSNTRCWLLMWVIKLLSKKCPCLEFVQYMVQTQTNAPLLLKINFAVPYLRTGLQMMNLGSPMRDTASSAGAGRRPLSHANRGCSPEPFTVTLRERREFSNFREGRTGYREEMGKWKGWHG